VVIAVLLPGLSNLLSVLELWPPEFDPTPVAAALGAAVLVWGLFKARLFDVVPIARELVIETMQDGVIISDSRGRVVDINAAAARPRLRCWKCRWRRCWSWLASEGARAHSRGRSIRNFATMT
jgi:hypothetical protein